MGVAYVDGKIGWASGGGDPFDAWSVVQKGAHFRAKADDVTTFLTDTQRRVYGDAFSDWYLGYVTISGQVYGFGVDPLSANAPDDMIVKFPVTTGETLSFGTPTNCSITGYPVGTTWIGGGDVYLDGSRLVMFGHQEPDFKTALLTSTDNGDNWTYVGYPFGSNGEVQAIVFDPDDSDILYMYISDNSTTKLAKASKAAFTTYAAGGAAPTINYRTRNGWSTTFADAIELASESITSNGVVRETISDVAYIPQIKKFFAVTHGDGGANTPYELGGYVIDPATPWELDNLDDDLYLDPASRLNANSDKPSNIGYISIVSPDSQIPADDQWIDLLRIDADDPDPGQPWDNTSITQVRLRPTPDQSRNEGKVLNLSAVGFLTSTPTGTSLLSLPSNQPVSLANGDDVMAWSPTYSIWRRYIVKDTGDWYIHPEQPEEGWILHATGNAGTYGDRYFSYVVTDDLTVDTGVQAINEDWAELLANVYSNTYIYNSSGIQGGKRYNDWDTLMGIIAINPGQKFIQFEQDEQISGLTNTSLNLDGVNMRGIGGTGGTELKIVFGDPTTSEQITITSWDDGSISNGMVLHNACPAILGTLNPLPRAEGQGYFKGVRAPVFKMNGVFDALILYGGGVTTQPIYPLNWAGINGASWSSGSGGLLTLTFGSDHRITSLYIGANFYMRNMNPAAYNGTRVIYDIPSATSIRLVCPVDPGAYVSGNNSWVVGEPAIWFSDALGAPQYHIIALSGDRPFLDRDSIKVDAGAVIVPVLNSASADWRTGYSTQFQNSGTIITPDLSSTWFATGSNLLAPTGGTIATSTDVNGQLTELDTATAARATFANVLKRTLGA